MRDPGGILLNFIITVNCHKFHKSHLVDRFREWLGIWFVYAWWSPRFCSDGLSGLDGHISLPTYFPLSFKDPLVQVSFVCQYTLWTHLVEVNQNNSRDTLVLSPDEDTNDTLGLSPDQDRSVRPNIWSHDHEHEKHYVKETVKSKSTRWLQCLSFRAKLSFRFGGLITLVHCSIPVQDSQS